MSYPLVSIVTVNYKQVQETVKMLESIPKTKYPNLEVIVVDNEETQDNSSVYQEAYPGVIVLRSEQNLGFAGGNNLGSRHAKGDYLYYLNNDTILTEKTIQPLIEAFAEDPQLGAASPKIRYFYTPEKIQYAGFSSIHPITGRNMAIGKNQFNTSEYDETRETYSVHGAAMMISRAVIEKVGLMSEDFFLYYEELDWSAQIQKAGYKIKYVGEAFVFHKESVATGKMSPLKTYYHTRNRILFMKRNFSKQEYRLFKGYFFSVVLPKEMIKYLFMVRMTNLKALLDGTFDAVKSPTIK
ncbi:glycosyltransferase family 2 protein [Algivirga pacifica]|uniref:Glycosyltransferase family 2 protein n=1 Tax=Algivirga pacifica TaxID=1162670 RepID=A0ABP9DH30_9BACT